MGLSLTRREGESIRIGDATVTVRHISGSRVKLTVQAPEDVVISRGELPDRPGGMTTEEAKLSGAPF